MPINTQSSNELTQCFENVNAILLEYQKISGTASLAALDIIKESLRAALAATGTVFQNLKNAGKTSLNDAKRCFIVLSGGNKIMEKLDRLAAIKQSEN